MFLVRLRALLQLVQIDSLAEILDKMAAALAHFVHNGVQII